MRIGVEIHFLAGLLVATGAAAAKQNFKINLSERACRMSELIENTELPERPEYPGLDESLGIDLGVLKSLQKDWTTKFDWDAEQDSLNKYHQYLTTIEGITVHFLHERSGHPGAIPLLLNHGWPGSFLEFIPAINPLTSLSRTPAGKPVSFDVIIPSLPGFAFSSVPPANWTLDDTARIFNKLMTNVLGYKIYAAHGTDFGNNIAYSLYDNFNKTVRAVHLLGVPFAPLSPAAMAEQNITLTPEEQIQEDLTLELIATGLGYSVEQSTKSNTIGLALYDNPVGQLSWIGEKYIEWSDPHAGMAPSILTHNKILLSVSLYYLTKSFVSSVFIYPQNSNGFKVNYTKARTDAPMLFSSFKYSRAFWGKNVISRVGNLVTYNYHDFGGHFPGLDNPPALITDLRQIGDYWTQ